MVTETATSFDEEIPSHEEIARWMADPPRVPWFVAESEEGGEVPDNGGTVATRDVIVHVIEEYARHAGHADLLRECMDGARDSSLGAARRPVPGSNFDSRSPVGTSPKRPGRRHAVTPSRAHVC